MNKEYFGYIRVSTVKQGEGVSLQAQQEAIERYCTTHGLHISRWFEEKETAAKQGRPLFTEMIKLLHKNAAQGVVMHKIDRSARNLRDWATVGDLSDAGIDVHFAAESVDFASRGGRLTADIQAVIAADYIRNLREETIKGMTGRLKQGIYPLQAPLGYRDNGGGKLKTICPKRGPLVKQLFEHYASGQHSHSSLVEVAHEIGLTSNSGRRVSKTCIEKLLRNPFYIGVLHIKTRGETYKGRHEPLLSTSLFERAQQRRKSRVFKKASKLNHTYRNVFKCTRCSRAFIPERQKGHVYYRCHTRGCTRGCLREELLETNIQDVLSGLELSTAQQNILEARMTGWAQGVLKEEHQATARLEVGKIRDRRTYLLDALLDGAIDKAAYENKNTELLLLETKLSEQRKEQIDPAWFDTQCVKFLELMKTLAQCHKLAIPAEKRQMLEILFSNLSISGKNVELEPKNWIRKAAISATDLYST